MKLYCECGKPATLVNDRFELAFCSAKCMVKSLQQMFRDFVEEPEPDEPCEICGGKHEMDIHAW